MPWPRWLDARTRRRFALAAIALFALPWLVGEWVKTSLQPGLVDHAESARLLVDFVVAGAMVFGLAALVTVACGCWVVSVMKGPTRTGDPFPADRVQRP
ncbi:MAG: hypothetical protein OEU94_14920 [Aquincola sp.]|nr:hypothetical protein [Aquincola sp.]MDH4289864.1 hypothetical protein [Aquincola sp.]MDH5331283.1 hypothetical protein [Aquincola sp.]